MQRAQSCAPELALAGASREAGADAAPRERAVEGYSGNQAALRRLSAAPRIQCKLEVGAVDDPLEAEADRAAEWVMRMSPPGSADCDDTSSRSPHRIVARKQAGANTAASLPAFEAPHIVHQALRSPSEPLDRETRAYFEPRFGADFSGVRVHRDNHANQSARAVQAHAYTFGSDIAFAAGRYSPRTAQGRNLLAHELAHVVQQSDGDARVRRQEDPYASLTIDQLRRRIADDPEAAWALRNRYRQMPISQLQRYKDAMAASVLAERNITPADAAGQGSFSDRSMRQTLESDIQQERASSGIVRQSSSAVQPDVESEGGTVGAARTDIPGLEGRAFIGRSPQAGGQVNPNSNFTPATDPNLLPQTHGHAEQGIADQVEAALSGIPPEELKGRHVWMLIEQEPCSTCAQGISDPDIAAGVLKKLSAEFPDVTFEVKNLDSSAIIVLKGNTNAPSATGTAASGASASSTASGSAQSASTQGATTSEESTEQNFSPAPQSSTAGNATPGDESGIACVPPAAAGSSSRTAIPSQAGEAEETPVPLPAQQGSATRNASLADEAEMACVPPPVAGSSSTTPAPCQAGEGEETPIPLPAQQGVPPMSSAAQEEGEMESAAPPPQGGGALKSIGSGLAVGAGMLVLGYIESYMRSQLDAKEINKGIEENWPSAQQQLQALGPRFDQLKAQDSTQKIYGVIEVLVIRGRTFSPSPAMDAVQESVAMVDSLKVTGLSTTEVTAEPRDVMGTGILDNAFNHRTVYTFSVPLWDRAAEEAKAQDAEKARLVEQLRQAAKRNPAKTAVPPAAPDSDNQSQLLPGPTSAPPPSDFQPLPGAPGPSPYAQAQEIDGRVKAAALALLQRGEKLMAGSPQQAEIDAFLQDESNWRAAARLIDLKFIQEGPAVGHTGTSDFTGSDELLNGDKYGGRLKQMRQTFGG